MNNIELLDDIIENNFSYKKYYPILKQFLEIEYCFLINAESLNPIKLPEDSYIVFSSIENYFTFPKIFLKGIFNALDINKNNKLSFENYVNGFLKIYTGTLDEKLKFVFDMFNINKDQFIYYNDVYLILNYTNIFDSKSHNNKMNSIIKSFFDNKEFMDYTLFSQITFQKNYGLFLIVLAIIFEHSNFNKEFSYIFDFSFPSYHPNSSSIIKIKPQEINSNISNTQIVNSDLSYTQSLFKNNSPLLYPKTGIRRVNSSKGIHQSTTINSYQSEISDYIKANYSIDIFPLLLNSNNNQINNLQQIQLNYNNILNLNSINSKKKSFDLNELQEFNEDLLELNQFENDYMNLKSTLLFEIKAMNEYRIPIASDECFLKNGIILSSNIKSNAKLKTPNSLFYFSSRKNENDDKNFSNSIDNSPLPDSLISNSSRGNTFTDILKSSQISQNFYNNIFEDETFVLNKNNEKMKPFYLFIIKNCIIVSGKKNEKIKIKYFIPLKNCYIANNRDVLYFNTIKYYKLILISTIQFKRRKFQLFFEKRAKINNITNIIIKETKYTVVKSDYTFIKDIGKGTFSQIKLMKHNKTNKLYAVKRINKNVSSIEEFKTINWEKDIIKFLMNYPNECKHIIKFYKIIETIEHLYIIQEYIETGSLSNFLKKNKIVLPSFKVRKIAEQIIYGVKELHDYGIIHRDLKLENILIDDSNENDFKIKIIDFGLSVVLTSKARTNENYGTFIYSSPEVLLSIPYNNKIDIWSLGVIFFYLEYTFLPFNIIGNEKENEQGIANKIVVNKLKFPIKKDDLNNDDDISNKIMAKLIIECLNKNLNERSDINFLLKIVKGEININDI